MLKSIQIRTRQHSQRGVVLLVTLIMLVAMTMAAIGLMRSVDTANVVAGNLAFQQSTYQVADMGTEQAIAYLYTVSNVKCDGTGVGINCPTGYKSFHEASLEPPTPGQTWESFWTAIEQTNGVVELTNMPAGYSGAFVIESMCDTAGQQGCLIATLNTSSLDAAEGQDLGSQDRAFDTSSTATTATYYRITTRVQGPRNSIGFVQALIAL